MATLLSLLKPVAYVSLPFIALQYSPRGRYYTRSIAYVSAIGFCATLGVFYAAGLSLVGRSFDVNNAVAVTFYAITSTVFGIRVEVEGEEWLQESGGRPGVLMGNHQSMLDLIIVGRLMPKRTSIMSKKSLQFSPVGPFMSMSGAIFIDRGNSSRALRSMDLAVNMMRSLRVSLWMYPEGTRHNSETPELLPFKKGGFHLAVQSGLPIIPLVAENYWHIYHKDVFESGVIRVRVLPPIPTTGLTTADIPGLVTLVRDQMLAALVEISTKAPSKPSTEKPIAPPEPASVSSLSAVLSDVVSDHTAAMPEDVVFEAKPAATPMPVSSRESLAGSAFEGVAGSENGTETEEDDEGMVLVGRPT
ncbi:1-acylglycerol-3-phosphate O-acyltransferase [Mycena maculata]|uniref:1-acylglycerol-3-phosphate O-acyltransferase n=1 Tax=Mycena maculata TaxID=230809 RepID=A0AAD7JUV9_9AGAR|nr:1-acylglycerol-3-phosphate O-acyltransferase [Mycena maculata]